MLIRQSFSHDSGYLIEWFYRSFWKVLKTMLLCRFVVRCHVSWCGEEFRKVLWSDWSCMGNKIGNPNFKENEQEVNRMCIQDAKLIRTQSHCYLCSDSPYVSYQNHVIISWSDKSHGQYLNFYVFCFHHLIIQICKFFIQHYNMQSNFPFEHQPQISYRTVNCYRSILAAN